MMALLIAPGLNGQDEAAKDSPQDQFQALVSEFQRAQRDLSKAYRAAKTKDEQLGFRRQMSTIGVDFTPRFLKLAKDHPSDPTAVEALSWIVTSASRFGGSEAGQALELLAKNHIDDERLGPVSERLRLSNLREAPTFLETVLEKSPHRNVRGQACYSLACQLKKSGARVPGNQQRAEKLFERVVAEYADVPARTGTLGTTAGAELFETRNLGIGLVAPDIVGNDLDGVKFKLSDYRGKIVVIDFWGDW
ncbi:MAG: hypothetical protein VCG02_08925 [Verrucomicrobiota bacterium]